MRQDAPRAKFFEPDSRDEPVADEPSPLELKNLGVEVDRRVRGALNDKDEDVRSLAEGIIDMADEDVPNPNPAAPPPPAPAAHR